MSLFSKNVNRRWVGTQKSPKFGQHSLRMTPNPNQANNISVCNISEDIYKCERKNLSVIFVFPTKLMNFLLEFVKIANFFYVHPKKESFCCIFYNFVAYSFFKTKLYFVGMIF